MIGEDVLYLSVGELGQRIRARSLSPVDLTEAYLQRSERLGPRLNAYATITRSVALEQARTAEREITLENIAGRFMGFHMRQKTCSR
jgi:aspartyl-tRNA(Asn)/glutamyl-tRNA(Gln) amidotransferase subunit A